MQTQYCLQNLEDNTNSENNFLPDINLFYTSPHMIIHPGVLLDFTSESDDLWRKTQKQALTKQIDIIETRMDNANISTPIQASIQTMSAIAAFEPVLTNFSLPDLYYHSFYTIFPQQTPIAKM